MRVSLICLFYDILQVAVFRGALSFDQELKWNLSNVETVVSMFEGAGAFDRELDTWDTSNIIDARRLFAAATSFSDGSISSWDVSRMVNLDEMFTGATSFNGDLGNWNLTNAKSLRHMFAGADSFSHNLCTWKKFMLSNEPETNDMFVKSGCPSSADPFVTARDAGPLCHYCSQRPCNDNSTDSTEQCTPLMHGDELRKVIAAYRQDASRYTAVASTYGYPIGKWNTSQLFDFRYAFFNDYSFTDDISEWDTSNAISMVSMFNGATWFRGDLSSWDVSRVIYTSNMFKNAEWFNQDISMWNLTSIHYADRMFYGATRFNQNLCDWRTRFLFNETRRVDEMFSYSGCPNKSSPLRIGSGPYCHECPSSVLPTPTPNDPSTFLTFSPTAAYLDGKTTIFPTTFTPTILPSHVPSVHSSTMPVSPGSSAPSMFPAHPITSEFPTTVSAYEVPDKPGHNDRSVKPTSTSSAIPTMIPYASNVASQRPSSSLLAIQTPPPSSMLPTSSSTDTTRCPVLKPLQFIVCLWAVIWG